MPYKIDIIHLVIAIMTFKKTASSPLEIELQQIASNYGFSPKVLSVNGLTFEMEDLASPCLADKYGDKIDDIPQIIWDEIVRILVVLYEVEGIEYIDITPYNFIECNGKVWIIDFGHAYYTKKPMNWFLRDLLDTHEKGWNPDFA